MEGTHPQAGRELTHIAFTAVVYGCTMPLCEKSTCYVSTYINVPLPKKEKKEKKDKKNCQEHRNEQDAKSYRARQQHRP